MKLSCLQENFNKGLMISSHIASKNANLPILSNILLKAENKIIKLITTNLEIGITCVLRGKVEEEGVITLEAKLLTDYVSLLPNERIDIKLKDQNIELKCKNFETKIRTAPADEFPLLPQVEKNTPYNCKISDFKKALSQVIFAVASNEIRPEISGVLFNFTVENGTGKLILAATDSYRLAEKTVLSVDIPEEKAGSSQSVIVPVKTLQEIQRILSILKETNEGNAPDTLSIYISENQILFSCQDVEVISRIIEGQYPDYKQIVPTSSKTQVTINKNDLIKTVKIASLFAKSGINDVSLNFSAKNGVGEFTVFAASNKLGENISKLETKFSGEKNSIVLNYRYLLDGLQNIDSEEVILEVNDSNSPCLIRPAEGNDYFYLVMPIKQ